jgi:seryl-tRNA synthetase
MSEASTPEATPADQAPEATKQQETFSRDYVQSLRDEAATYRTKAKTAAEEAKAAVIKEYEGKLAEKDTAFTELQTAHTEASTLLTKLKAVVAAKIPVEDIEDVVALVQGDNEEAIGESVKRVQTLLAKAPATSLAIDTTQGKGGQAVPLNGNPVLEILERAVGVRQ